MSKYTVTEGAMNGQKLRQDYGRDRSDDKSGREEQMKGREMKGGRDSLDHTIKGAKANLEGG